MAPISSHDSDAVVEALHALTHLGADLVRLSIEHASDAIASDDAATVTLARTRIGSLAVLLQSITEAVSAQWDALRAREGLLAAEMTRRPSPRPATKPQRVRRPRFRSHADAFRLLRKLTDAIHRAAKALPKVDAPTAIDLSGDVAELAAQIANLAATIKTAHVAEHAEQTKVQQ